jgi:hypothetical protein
MGSLIRRWIFPLLFAVLPGLVVLSGYLLPANSTLVSLRDYLVECAVIVAAFAFLLGVFNILRVHSRQVRRRRPGWYYSLMLLFAMLVAMLAAVRLPILPGALQEMAGHFLFDYVISPLGASLAALVVFTLALAAFRLLRARLSPATVLFLAVATVALLGSTPLVGLEWLADARDWIVNVPGMAGMRGLLLGVALGTVITAIRVFLTVERPYSES